MRFNLQMFSTAMKLLPLLCLCLLTRSGTTFAFEQVIIFMKNGSDGVLPCSLSTKQNIEEERFEWKKDSQEVFIFDGGIVDENQQFKGRVSHFPDELQYGNASIIIRNTKVTDSGNYSCDFPHLQPRQTFHIQLVVVGPGAITVKEDSNVVLPCSLSSKENIMSKVFDWKKDGQKEVFFYDGNTSRLSGQDQQFKGRVSHFPDELRYGNASIIIRNTKVTDSGDYSCDFPRLQPRQIFHIQLVVDRNLKDRSGDRKGAVPSVTTLNQTKDWALLQCKVPGVSSKTKVEWKDKAGKVLAAKESEDSNIILQTTVNKSDNYSCVATQKGISHNISTYIYVYISEPPKESSTESPKEPTKEPTNGWVVGVPVVLVVVGGVLAVLCHYRKRIKTFVDVRFRRKQIAGNQQGTRGSTDVSTQEGEGNTIQPPHSTQNLLSTSDVLELHTNGTEPQQSSVINHQKEGIYKSVDQENPYVGQEERQYDIV